MDYERAIVDHSCEPGANNPPTLRVPAWNTLTLNGQ